MNSSMRASSIADLLKSRKDESPVEQENMPPTCDVVYALFLEPRTSPDPRWSNLEYCIDKAVRLFQPSPTLSHCELIIPPIPTDEGLRTQFATYFGRSSAWQTDKVDGYSFYLVENANRWRAIPIFSANAAAKVRDECDRELGVQYSLGRYLTASPPLRYFASWVPDQRRSAAHCATLTARVLKNSFMGTDATPLRPSAYYGPSTLYQELSATAQWRGERMGASKYEGMSLQAAASVEKLLRGVMTPDTVSEVGDPMCMEAVRALTMRACTALSQSDDTAQRITQQQLATALLRWVILRGLSVE